MAWNKYYIFIEAPGTTDLDDILQKLGLSHYNGDTDALDHLCQFLILSTGN